MVSQALAINPNNSTDTHFGWSETDVLFRNSRIFKRHKRFLFRQVLAADKRADQAIRDEHCCSAVPLHCATC
ncbi:hypothetical protein Y032_0017g3450 [Ancylostoma ceylanicum]|uniref:Uncharacterized protein n=1 Tax=Ancylostoma ceylanicum TaxID=53326 RepID=A0A016V5S1_9BILA|nr:hypothetical protein Y032_0017g3450 [Ancylostoma ceylanicum]